MRSDQRGPHGRHTPCARGGWIATLFAAALLTQTKSATHRLLAKVRTAKKKSLLRETAKLADLTYSNEAMRSFELVCDGIVYFGNI